MDIYSISGITPLKDFNWYPPFVSMSYIRVIKLNSIFTICVHLHDIIYTFRLSHVETACQKLIFSTRRNINYILFVE